MGAAQSYPLTGIASDWRIPGSIFEIQFGQGPSTASAGQREAIIPGPILAAGASWTPGTVYRITGDSQVIAGAGAGSPLHRALKAFMAANPRTPLYALPYAASSGGTPVAATGTITYTGAATTGGVMTNMICGEVIQTAYKAGDTAIQIATAAVGAINSKSHLPVTAGNGSGSLAVVTLTAKVAGASQGDGTTGNIRFRALVETGAGTTVATSGAALGLGTGTPGTDGTTTELANFTAALLGIAGSFYYYMGICTSIAGFTAALKSHLVSKALPINGMRSVGATAFTGSVSSCITLANTLNYERIRMVWQANSEHDMAHLAGNWLGEFSSAESNDAAVNMDGWRSAGNQGCYLDTDRPTPTDLNNAINNGISAIATNGTGAYLVMACDTRSKDPTGAYADFRCTESHRISGADYTVATMQARYATTYNGQKLRDDERLPNGSVNPNQKVPRGVATPSRMKPMVFGVLDQMEGEAILQEVAASKAAFQIIKSPTNSGRVESQGPIRVIDHLHQFTCRLDEVSPG